MSPGADQYREVRFQGVRAHAPSGAIAPWSPAARAARSTPGLIPPRIPHTHLLSPADFALLDFLFKRAHLCVAAYRLQALGRRVPACLRALQVRSPGDAIRRLEQDPHALDIALNTLLIGVTAFFRDTPAFDYLRSTALPELLRSSPAPRILSIGCSDGAEVYSLAILLRDLGIDTFHLRGIDCRRKAILRARSGLYPLAALADLSPLQRAAYFDFHPQAAQVKGELRDRVQFQVADAFVDPLHSDYDLVACRNFSIYLEHPAAARLWRRIHAALRPGGLLFTGKAERPAAGFLRAGPCLFRKASA
jgi:chemotaxis methyl-accepting protein methylase